MAIDKAEDALKRAISGGVKVSTSHYNLLLDIAGKSSGSRAPERTEVLFNEMIATNLEPDIGTYNAVMRRGGVAGA